MQKAPRIDNQDELEKEIPDFNFIWLNDITKFSIESDANSTSIYVYGRYWPRVSINPTEDQSITEKPLIGFLFDDVELLKLPATGFPMLFGELGLRLFRNGKENGSRFELIDHLERDFVLRCNHIYFLGCQQENEKGK